MCICFTSLYIGLDLVSFVLFCFGRFCFDFLCLILVLLILFCLIPTVLEGASQHKHITGGSASQHKM